MINYIIHRWGKNSYECSYKWVHVCKDTGSAAKTSVIKWNIILCFTAGKMMTICFSFKQTITCRWCLLMYDCEMKNVSPQKILQHRMTDRFSAGIKRSVPTFWLFCFSYLPYNRQWLLHIMFNNWAPANAGKWEVNCSVNCIYLACESGFIIQRVTFYCR